MNGALTLAHRRLHHRLRHGGMSMDCAGDILCIGAQFNGQGRFGDQVAGVRPHDMRPQHPATNRGIWQELEGNVRSLVNHRGEAWVVVGDLFLAGDTARALPTKWLKRGGKNFVAVPTHLFKVVLARDTGTKKLSEYAFLIPNSPKRTRQTPADFMVCVDSLEQLTGWDFFPWLEKELSTQENRIPTVWSW